MHRPFKPVPGGAAPVADQAVVVAGIAVPANRHILVAPGFDMSGAATTAALGAAQIKIGDRLLDLLGHRHHDLSQKTQQPPCGGRHLDGLVVVIEKVSEVGYQGHGVAVRGVNLKAR